jgi:hypothetical protein
MLPIYKYLDHLPSPPPTLVGCLTRFYKNTTFIHRSENVIDPNKIKYNVNVDLSSGLNPKEFYNFAVDGELLTWLKINIIPDANTYAVGLYGPVDSVNNNRPIHIDWSRDYVMMYLTEPGGESVETTWYKSNNRPLVLNKDCKDIFHLEELTELTRVCFEPNRWVVFNTKIIHQVTGLTGLRQCIQMGFNQNLYGLI